MFSLFRKDKTPTFKTTDKIWKTEEGSLKGLLMMAMMRIQHQGSCFILTFFEEDSQKLGAFMNANQINFTTIDESSSLEDMRATSIYLLNDKSLLSTVVNDLLNRNAGSFNGEILLPGHYPLLSVEEKLLTKLAGMGYLKFTFCLSFDDPTLKLFTAHNILPLLEKLGLDEHEAIEHDMVSRSLKNARKKIEGKVKTEIKAKSMKEWFALNVKS